MTSVDSSAAAAVSGFAFTVIAGTLTYATLSAQSQIFGRTILGPPEPNQLALTFDDGPNPAATPQLLEVLARHNARATFFLIGDFVLREPALTREIAAAGHVIGNHTMSHPWLPFVSAPRIRAELAGCNDALEATLGHSITLFRPPHGALRPAVLRAARSLGLQTIKWNLLCNDWDADSAATILARLETGMARNRRRRRGTNVVLHDGGHAGLNQPRLKTVEAVAQLLERVAPNTVFVTPTGKLEKIWEPR
jgi:peptidoglycan/xylan/chitin deacetylase (PgdA/CDA1 family)